MPGSILCLDCMEELGEVLDDSSSSGGDDAAPPAAVGLPGAVRTGATELAAGAGVAAAADGVASASGPLPHPTGDEGPGDLEKDAGALVWEAAGIDVEVARLFRELDSDNSGYLERGEVWELVKRLGRELSAEQLAEAMAELDPNGDGRVSVAEFAGWWKLAGKKRQGFLGRIFAETRGQMAKGLRSRIVHARAQVGSKWGALRQSVRRRSMRRVALALKRRLAGAAAALRHPLASSRALKLRWREKKEAKRRSAEEEARRAAEQDEYALSPALMALLAAEEEAQATAEEAGEEGGHTVVDEAEREDEQIMAMFAVFQQFDRDRSGFIDAKELRGVLAAQGFEMTQAEAAAMLEGMDEIEKDGLISFEEFYTCVQRQAAAHGKPLRSMADAIETLQDMRREIEEKARAGERQEARKRARSRWAQAAEAKRLLLVKHLQVEAERAKEEAALVAQQQRKKRLAAHNSRGGRGGRRGRGGRGGAGGRGRAGSAAFKSVVLDPATALSYLDEEGEEQETTVEALPTLIETGAVGVATQLWKAGMAEWLTLYACKAQVEGMLAVVQDGERRRDLAQNTELAQLFREMDADGSGGLDREEVGLLLGRLGFHDAIGGGADDERFEKLWGEMDTDGSGDIDFAEFRAWFVSQVAGSVPQLQLQQRRERAARFASMAGVRRGPLWDLGRAQEMQQGHTEAEREGFHVPPEWEKRIAAIMSMGCGREMAIGALRQCNGHGGKARRIASEKLHVGKPADLPNAVAERLSEEDMRYRMRAHFLGEVQRLDQTKVDTQAVGKGRLAGGTLDRILGRVDLSYQAPAKRLP